MAPWDDRSGAAEPGAPHFSQRHEEQEFLTMAAAMIKAA